MRVDGIGFVAFKPMNRVLSFRRNKIIWNFIIIIVMIEINYALNSTNLLFNTFSVFDIKKLKMYKISIIF